MASEITKTIKEPFIIYLDLEYMIERLMNVKIVLKIDPQQK